MVKNNLLSIPDVAPTTKDGLTYSVTNGVLSVSGTATTAAWATNVSVWPDIAAILGKKIFMQFYITGTIPGGASVYTPINIGYGVSAAASTSVFGTVASYSGTFRVVVPKNKTINANLIKVPVILT